MQHHIPVQQQLVWQPEVVAPSESYFNAIQPPGVLIQQTLAPENLIGVPVYIKDGFIVHGLPQQEYPQVMQPPLQYVTLQPPPIGGSLNMNDVNNALPTRPILVPRRPTIGVRFPAERSLRGSSVATRRPSAEFVAETPIKKPSITSEYVNTAITPLNLAEKQTAIVEILESYFSDENLSKNPYLLKQVTQREDGYVSLKRVASIKRLRCLTKDEHMVAQCVRKSTKLKLSPDGTMIRRTVPLPTSMDAPRFIRTVIAINLPLETPTIESVTSLFVSYGDLTQVRVLKPGKKVPAYLKEYQAWVPDLGQNYCALVEFENQDEAQRACREINMKNRTNESLRVALLKPGARLRRTLYRKYKGHDETSDTPAHLEVLCGVNMASPPEQTRDYDASGSASDSDGPVSAEKCKLRPTHTAWDSGYSHSSGDEKKLLMSRQSLVKAPKRTSQPQTQQDFSDSNDGCGLRAPQNSFLQFGVIRQPIGPKDNSIKGFFPGFRKHMR
ncbi:uncharacterized protein LOC143459106 [Clavelina lepadiformis]|uniref:uncharacterized protein LOC143459106 n=1 Tax=Clavelina lepadiformis TaxID=159417 RepID=UPI004041DF6E